MGFAATLQEDNARSSSKEYIADEKSGAYSKSTAKQYVRAR